MIVMPIDLSDLDEEFDSMDSDKVREVAQDLDTLIQYLSLDYHDKMRPIVDLRKKAISRLKREHDAEVAHTRFSSKETI